VVFECSRYSSHISNEFASVDSADEVMTCAPDSSRNGLERDRLDIDSYNSA